MTDRTEFYLEVQPRIPAELSRLEDLASNLIYSWDRKVRALFLRLDQELWDECGHSPKIFLRRIDQTRLEQAVADPVYMQDYARVTSLFDAYLAKQMDQQLTPLLDETQDLISYSCAEFGLHESLPIYSGGLGILAGDHCKAASDMGVPLVGMGLLYRKGYFRQKIDGHGRQQVRETESNFNDLPIVPVQDEQNRQLTFSLSVGGDEVYVQLWQAKVGHILIYLMDADFAANSEENRKITHQLYGGDSRNRLRQEMILGIGGAKAHQLLGLQPTIWHINEGHAAFQILERCRLLVAEGLDFEAALQAVAANTVFTTHTPVPAGHDIFEHSLINEHFDSLVQELGISMERFHELGFTPGNEQGFNMTTLALKGSRFHNGVSKIHGEVASKMSSYIWEQIPHEYNPMSSVTNGIHVPTFLASEWASYFDGILGGGWRNELINREYWEQLDSVPNHRFWSIRETLKSMMLEFVLTRYSRQLKRGGFSGAQIKRMTALIDPRKTDTLTVGFARRFATYKRATLLFANPDRLEKIVNNPEQPIVFIFAGKAHPHDEPGQNLIKQIHDYSLDPRFEGKIVLLEDFDVAVARKLVTGVDVWLNNPIHPLEASGTSGQKAAINGVLNLSILDGWWDEGYRGNNGWAITAHDESFSGEFRDKEENNELLDLLEYEVMPLYYDRDGHGYSSGWIDMCKQSMISLIPRFNSRRMVMDYVKRLYSPASRQGKELHKENFSPAKELAQWKQKIDKEWHHVQLYIDSQPDEKMFRDNTFMLKVRVALGELAQEDIKVECLFDFEQDDETSSYQTSYDLNYERQLDNGEALFSLSVAIAASGKHCYAIRAYPYHQYLCHPFEAGYMQWL